MTSPVPTDLRAASRRLKTIQPHNAFRGHCPDRCVGRTPRTAVSFQPRRARRAPAVSAVAEKVSSDSANAGEYGLRKEQALEAERDGVSGDYTRGIMLQGFGWSSCRERGWYRNLESKIPDMRRLGITAIWLPPPSQSVSLEGYMPSQLYDLNTAYGTEAELRSLIAALKAANIRVLGDIVINHRCADQQDASGAWNTFLDKVPHPGKSIAWGKWAIVGGDGYGGTGGADSGADFGPAPDLDHNNVDVRESLRDWLNWLHHDVGFDGWRLDYVKGYAAKWVKYYIEETVGGSALNVGEYWTDLDWADGDLKIVQDGARQALCDYIDASGRMLPMYDFVQKGCLQEAVKRTEYFRLRDPKGLPTGLLGWWPSKSVTFVGNHDTDSTQNHWPFPRDKLMTGYAYICTHPGMPCLLYEHVFQDGLFDQIARLVRVRKRNSLHMRSSIEILCADADMYVAKIDQKLIVKLGPRYDMGRHLPCPDEGWALAASGVDFAIWDKFGKDD